MGKRPEVRSTKHHPISHHHPGSGTDHLCAARTRCCWHCGTASPGEESLSEILFQKAEVERPRLFCFVIDPTPLARFYSISFNSQVAMLRNSVPRISAQF